ncbi:RHS repeat-associated core domain-containing protein [Saccharothrix variisporea]|uniref:RHS repeat-associated protein n=1 Tax=Saccharothrix variisporea TaxID=543527 RepID=A0A495X4T2_9PSEU|nr:RHS repeat-associated core domain-containing protein [Saccharothrix variisporea]RKT69311.1 RHS repeat-associated protein [Saccharothrix variisporea]
MIDPNGDLAWRARTTLWGQPADGPGHGVSCPLRFPGQYHDVETGLHYNYFRHYDPEAGRYTSIDPLGLAGGLNPSWYVPNGFSWADPFGLTPCRTTPRMEDGNSKQGWRHIEKRHIPGGDDPSKQGSLFAPGTTRDQIEKAAEEMVRKGTRQSDPSPAYQVFERRMTINGLRTNYRLIVDSTDGNNIITMFPIGR